MKKIMLSILAACAVAVTASAQTASTYTFEHVTRDDQAPQIKVAGTQLKMAFEAKVVPNAPYQAEATTESVMTLADGNRIVKKTATRVYRDSAGRTRKETLGPDGQATSVFIADPVAKTNLALDPETQTANRAVSVFYAVTHLSDEPDASATVSHAGALPADATITVSTTSGVATTQVHEIQKSVIVTTGESGVLKVQGYDLSKGDVTKEDLGEQTIEGVMAKGSRTTTVVPAGTVDNEQPIRIVSEEWFSPELQVLVLTKHSDPRVGETTYRLANISRTEPAKSLFVLPAGYTVKTPEAGTHMEVIRK
jgi:hypothetical protein